MRVRGNQYLLNFKDLDNTNKQRCRAHLLTSKSTKSPAKFIHLEDKYGQLLVGHKASMLLLDATCSVCSNWIDGGKVY